MSEQKAIQNIINYIEREINNTKDNWIKKGCLQELLDVAKVNFNKNKKVDNITDYIIQELDQCKGNFIRESVLKYVFKICSKELALCN